MTFEEVIKNFTTRGLCVEDIRRYLDSGGDGGEKDAKMQWSLLHFAAEDRNPDAIRLLVAHGANLSATDRNGWTPLHVAVDSDLDTSAGGARRATDLPTVRALIELGADASARAKDGGTPREIAIEYGQEALYDSVSRFRAA